MAGADAVSSHPFALRSREIARPHHASDLRQISGDLSAESKQIESCGHDHCAIHVSEVRDKLCGFEHCGVPRNHRAGIARFVVIPPNVLPFNRSPLRCGDGVEDLSCERPKAPPGFFSHERVFHPYMTPIGSTSFETRSGTIISMPPCCAPRTVANTRRRMWHASTAPNLGVNRHRRRTGRLSFMGASSSIPPTVANNSFSQAAWNTSIPRLISVPFVSSAIVIVPALTSMRPGPETAMIKTGGIACCVSRPPLTDCSQCAPE